MSSFWIVNIWTQIYKKDCRFTRQSPKSYNSFVRKIVFLQNNNNLLTFDWDHTLSCFFSPHSKNEDEPIHTIFGYPQGQSVFPIHNTVGQNSSWRATYSFHTKRIISVSVSMNLRISGSSRIRSIDKTMFRITGDWRQYVM